MQNTQATKQFKQSEQSEQSEQSGHANAGPLQKKVSTEVEKSYLSIRNWAEKDRPRERLLEHGARSLSETELLAIIINTGSGKASAVDLAKHLLRLVENDLQLLSRLSVDELQKIKGIGEAKSITLHAAFELSKRIRFGEAPKGESIKVSRDVFQYVRPMLSALEHEEFWVLYLNRGNKIIAKERLSSGGTAGTVTDVKMIVRNAVNKLSDAIVIVHNHPSGTLDPSKADRHITKKIKEAVVYFDMRFLDHLIVAGENYYSFADEGLL